MAQDPQQCPFNSHGARVVGIASFCLQQNFDSFSRIEHVDWIEFARAPFYCASIFRIKWIAGETGRMKQANKIIIYVTISAYCVGGRFPALALNSARLRIRGNFELSSKVKTKTWQHIPSPSFCPVIIGCPGAA